MKGRVNQDFGKYLEGKLKYDMVVVVLFRDRQVQGVILLKLIVQGIVVSYSDLFVNSKVKNIINKQ